MSRIRLAVLIVCLVAPAVAHAADGNVSLYLQPLPPEASKVTFVIASVSAVTASGSEAALKLNVKAIGPADAGRQRLLASARLQTGSYTGFVFRIKQATLKTGRQDLPLAVPDVPVRLDLPFGVAAQQASLFWVGLTCEDPAAGAAFNPVFSALTPPKPIAGHAGFVSNSGSNTITVFDKGLQQVVAVIDTCGGPAGMALDQRRQRLYVACRKDDEVQSIDVTTGEIVERSRLSPGDRPREVALTPDGVTLLSLNAGSNSISFFDAISLNRGERVSVGSGPGSILVDPTGRRAFVFNTLSSTISVLDVANRSLVATLSTDPAPLRGQFSARADKLYVIHERSPYMTVLDPRQLTVVTRARVRPGIGAIVVDKVRDLVCIGGSNDTTVEFYDPNALMPLYSMRTKAGVSYLAIDAEDNSLYMVGADSRSLLVGRLADRKVAAEIDVGDAPYWVAVMGEK